MHADLKSIYFCYFLSLFDFEFDVAIDVAGNHSNIRRTTMVTDIKKPSQTFFFSITHLNFTS